MTLTHFERHRLVALPERAREILKIGGGTPTRIVEGWLVLSRLSRRLKS